MDDDYEYDDYDSEEYLDFKKTLKEDDYEEDTLKSLTDRLHKIKQNHGKTMQYQAYIRAHEAKDRNIIEHNYERVNFWSAVHLLAMICTAVFQVRNKPLAIATLTQILGLLPEISLCQYRDKRPACIKNTIPVFIFL